MKTVYVSLPRRTRVHETEKTRTIENDVPLMRFVHCDPRDTAWTLCSVEAIASRLEAIATDGARNY